MLVLAKSAMLVWALQSTPALDRAMHQEVKTEIASIRAGEELRVMDTARLGQVVLREGSSLQVLRVAETSRTADLILPDGMLAVGVPEKWVKAHLARR